ncbi:MAG: FapA family protein, partial [Lentisphaerota bacterium]
MQSMSGGTPALEWAAGLPFLEPELGAIMERAFPWLTDPVTGKPATPSDGLIHHLQTRWKSEQDPLQKEHIHNLLNDLRTHFFAPSRTSPELNDGQVYILPAPDGFAAWMILIPPRGGGSVPTINKILATLEKKGIRHGIDIEAVKRSLETLLQSNDIIWQAPIARGELPIASRNSRPDFLAHIVDKNELRNAPAMVETVLSALGEPVKEGAIIARIKPPQTGVIGRDIYGKTIAPPESFTRPFEYSDDFQISNAIVVARTPGYIFVDECHVNIVPVYVIEKAAQRKIADFSFDGAVLVQGNLQGPGSLTCEDLFVLGNCEQMNIVSRGDVFITGGIIGRRQGKMDADGGIYASFVSEANLAALGEIVVQSAIVNS